MIENLTEAEILGIDKAGDVANCAICEYRFDPSGIVGAIMGAVAANHGRYFRYPMYLRLIS